MSTRRPRELSKMTVQHAWVAEDLQDFAQFAFSSSNTTHHWGAQKVEGGNWKGVRFGEERVSFRLAQRETKRALPRSREGSAAPTALSFWLVVSCFPALTGWAKGVTHLRCLGSAEGERMAGRTKVRRLH